MRSILIATLVTLPVIVMAMLGLVFVRAQTGHAHHKTIPAAAPTGFTDSNGNQFTVFVGGTVVNGTNITVTNRDLKAQPAPGASPAVYHTQ